MKLHELLKYIGGPQKVSIVDVSPLADGKLAKSVYIGDILDYDVETARFFFEIGMHCLGCPHSRGESIAEACAVHGTDADALVAKINAYLSSKA